MSKSVEVTRTPNRYVTITQEKNVYTVEDPDDNTIELHDPGVAGPPNVLSVGSVTIGAGPQVSITGIPPSQVLNFVFPTYVTSVNGVSGAVINIATTTSGLNQFASTTSSQLAGVISDETGTGSLVFNTSPTFVTGIGTSSNSFNLLNTTATTINFAGAATSINVGASGGTVTVAGRVIATGGLTVETTPVTTVGAATGYIFKYDGTKFAPSAPYLNDLFDATITAPEEFQVLEYNGSQWVNVHAASSVYVRNAEATTLTAGTVVYLFGATGDHATVKRASNVNDSTSSKTVGVVHGSIAASQNGTVITQGYVDGIDLSVGYSPGDVLWLGTNGQFTKTKPSAPDHLVFVGVVVRATNNGIIYVSTQNGYELDELHNVSIPSPQSGQVLTYNGSLWTAASIPGSLVVQVFTVPGVATTGTGNRRFYAPQAMTIKNVRLYAGTAPVGASLIVDINKNSTSIYTTQANRPTLTSGSNYDATSVPDILSLSAGDYVTIDIDQIGSSVAGSDLSIQLEFSAP